MFIVLHCGGIAFNGNTIRERSLGGSETAAYHLARELARKGHTVRLFTFDQNEGMSDGVLYVYAGTPSEQFPLGDRFHMYAQGTPHDVLIVQRHPLAFVNRFACKLAFLWMHDLALHRNRPAYEAGAWQTTGTFVVSEYHQKQVCDVLGIPPSAVLPITNGVDPERFAQADAERGRGLRLDARYRENVDGYDTRDSLNEFAMLYSSRPERGLEHLVRPGGIMERVAKEAPNAHLYVCAYQHDVPEMRAYYDGLAQRCRDLPNVTLLGHLTQAQLADVMMSVQLHIYPTQFEEVSCITAMECMHAGLPMLTSKHAALPETCKGAGVIMVEQREGALDEDMFVKHAVRLATNGLDSREYTDLVRRQLAAAKKYTWQATADQVLAHISAAFERAQDSAPRMLRHLLRMSDVQLAKQYADDPRRMLKYQDDPIYANCLRELELYAFMQTPETYRDHYLNAADRLYDGSDSPAGEDMSQHPRFGAVASRVAGALDGGADAAGDGVVRQRVVVDLGCAHGHITMGLARRFPEVRMVGLDVSARAIAEARRIAERDGITNVEFHVCDADDLIASRTGIAALNDGADVLLMCEVLEHVFNPWEFAAAAQEALVRKGGTVMFTTPFGPWEDISNEKLHPMRFHVQHLERSDLEDMFAHLPKFAIMCMPVNQLANGDLIGNYIGSYVHDGDAYPLGINWERKLSVQVPRQTSSLCMIVKDAALTLAKTLEQLRGATDEVVIALDPKTSDATLQVIRNFAATCKMWPLVQWMPGAAALEVGFDVARNVTVDAAVGDWVLWVDADEDVVGSNLIPRYLRMNHLNGYAVPQHHFAVQPAGILTTDYPVRLFRNDVGIKFLGCVHEHPEIGVNEGVRYAVVMPGVSIAHHGYYTEEIRRARFQRNINLMMRDRQTNPDRTLGKFLWMRDLMHMVAFTMEQNGAQVDGRMHAWAQEAIGLFEQLLAKRDLRMVLDSLEYYSRAVQLLGGGVDFAVRLDASRDATANLGTVREVHARFASRAHIDQVVGMMLDEKTKTLESRYW